MPISPFKLICSLFVIHLLFSCYSDKEENNAIRELTFKDVSGQWKLCKIDTIASKQSLEVNKGHNNIYVEYEVSSIKEVNGILKCVSLCPTEIPVKEIEFANDSIFEYCFPTHMRTFHKIEVSNNQLNFKGMNSIWTSVIGEIEIALSPKNDTLRIEYLENTGLFLSEVYVKSNFDQELVSFLRKYGHNLPYAHGKYALVHYDFESVDYDSPFEHYHSFPHAVPETLDLSKEDLLKVLQNESEILLLTDGVLKPYDLSWSWGDRLWISPKDWYEGPDTSAFILYDKVK